MHLRLFSLLLLTLLLRPALGQRGLAFTRFSTEDGSGLSNNVVTSIYQDGKGFMWVGTSNGLQRFDGRKFIHFNLSGRGQETMPYSGIGQIIPADSGLLLLSYPSIHQFGILNPRTFQYRRITLHNRNPLPPRAEFRIYRTASGKLWLNISGRELLQYDQKRNSFEPMGRFGLPSKWKINLGGVFEDTLKQQVWFGCDSGLAIYDRASRQTWTRHYNPRRLPVLNNPRLQDHVTEVFIDRQRRIWLFSWPTWGGNGQYKFCLDSTGSRFLTNDTLGLNNTRPLYTEYQQMYQSRDGVMWVYGLNVLCSYEKEQGRFVWHRSNPGTPKLSMDYDLVYQMLQDKDGGLWFATDRGLYFTAYGENSYSTTNLVFGENKQEVSINDIMQMPGGDYWLATWGGGIRVIKRDFTTQDHQVYRQKPERVLPPRIAGNAYLNWTLCRQQATGKVWIGCNGGVLLIHDPAKGTTEYLRPPELNNSTIRFIVEDGHGRIWMGTQGGRVVRWENGKYTVLQQLGTIVYKIFIDRAGTIWLATHDKGLYVLDSTTGKIIRNYTTEDGLYTNTGFDIEQLNDSTIVYGAGALNFINKRTGKIRHIDYASGLPSNTVARLRMDGAGFLWIVTANGLCRYNPANNRITSYGRSDGIIVGEQTSATDFVDDRGRMLFGGDNALLVFDPAAYRSTQPPADVTITDFRLFNQFLPADSLAHLPQVKLHHQQNTFAIHFASLSYVQRNKLTYYYQMKGIDKDWIAADPSNVVNYQLLRPGRYVFRVYCETIEGIRSSNITEWHIHIRPPFYQTRWFWSAIALLLGILIYFIHSLRVNRLLAVEKLRNRVARDLHDDMGSTLSTINILSAMAKTKMHTDAVRTSEYLTKISDNSQRMMEAMDDIVWSIKPTNDSMQRIAARMREFATSVLEARDTELDFQVQEEVYEVKLNMEARRDFFLLFKEAVNNAAKYAKAGKVTVRLGLKQRNLVMRVADDGCGFDVQAADGGNGLGNMQKRADAMHGKVRIESACGKGTSVTVTIPLAQRIQS